MTGPPPGDVVPLRWWHLPAVLDLEKELFAPEQWSLELFYSELAQGADRWYVAAVPPDGTARLLGYAGLAAVGADAAIQTIGVAPGAQRCGLGTLLLTAMLDEAGRRAAASVVLEVRADNAVAQRLYARHGFAAVGVRRGYYQPSGTDAVVMVREL